MPKVDVGVACSAFQSPRWWQNLMGELLISQELGVTIGGILTSSSALPDHNKNEILSSSPWNPEYPHRAKLTDANRVDIVNRFMNGDSDYIYWLDDDTIHPSGTLVHFLGLNLDAVSGLYFNPKPPHNPLVYLRRDDNLYNAFYGYTKGELKQVDSVGMGCSLIHRSVFEKIMDQFIVYQRPNASLVPIHKDDIVDDPYFTAEITNQQLVNGILMTPLIPLEDSAYENRAFPFFALEYNRTEDHHFWELADRVGVRPWIDTTIICKHLKVRDVTDEHYYRYISEEHAKAMDDD